MLAGQVAPDGGEIQSARGTTFGYLPRITSYNVCYTKLLRSVWSHRHLCLYLFSLDEGRLTRLTSHDYHITAFDVSSYNFV